MLSEILWGPKGYIAKEKLEPGMTVKRVHLSRREVMNIWTGEMAVAMSLDKFKKYLENEITWSGENIYSNRILEISI